MNVVVIPCYKVKKHILNVISGIGPEVDRIYAVDDCCPESSGIHIEENCRDPRVRILFNEKNMGVGGAVIVGYRKALEDGATIVIKVDGDGQMDTTQIGRLIAPILAGEADYCKGNRFFWLDELAVMPKARLFGNSMLSLINKVVNGYWHIVDPTNGFTAIHAEALRLLPLDKLANRYFFESDMLFRLATIRAVVQDIPIPAIYGEEKSSLKIGQVLWKFPRKYMVRFFKRIFYMYVLRDFNAGSIQLFVGFPSMLAGLVFGLYNWIGHLRMNTATPTGTIMITVLLLILGFQLMLGALNFDVQNAPGRPVQKNV
jgi:glycosyltransferase involved in cell wall biosynthesis